MGTILVELRRSHFVALARQAGNVRTPAADRLGAPARV